MNHNRPTEQTRGQMVAAALVLLAAIAAVTIVVINGIPYLISLFGE